ncbi:MAG: NYN domain-containing protein [Acidobacteriota bacterium]|nr:NYN domain-containing protein [Acidobacteriota bacterium]
MQIDERKIAVFIDFENVAMGVRESRYGNFDIDLVLKRLVEKGKITVKRAYSDWHRYAEFKRAFHQAAIELIDVPQSRYSGKNSADIRMVVDALDLSYQRDHIDTFVLVSGDSDFSPLVSKLRENGRYVIGMGVKQSSSDLLINNCDEFIFYEDLVRPSTENTTLAPKLNGLPRKKAEALRLVVETFEALQREGKEFIYGSVIKQTLVRKLPSFNEAYFGYPSFSRLLEDAAENKLLQLTKDQKSGGYIVTLSGDGTGTEAPSEEKAESTPSGGESPPPAGKSSAPTRTRSSRGRRQGARENARTDPQPPVETAPTEPRSDPAPQAFTKTPEAPAESSSAGETASAEQSTESSPPVEKKTARPRRRSPRSPSAGSKQSTAEEAEVPPAAEIASAPPEQPVESASATPPSPEEEQASVQEPSPGETTAAEQSTESSPTVEKKTARPRRRSPRRRGAASKQSAPEATEVAPAAEIAPAPPEKPAESATAADPSAAGEQASVQEPSPGETTAAEQSTEPSPTVEKKAARPRRRSPRSRTAGSRKSASKAAEEAAPAEVPADSPEQPPESLATAAAPAAGGRTSVEEASPVEAPPADAPLLSGAAAPTTEPDSDGGAAPKRRRKTTTARKKTTRSKTTRSRKSPARDTEPTLFSQIEDSSSGAAS